ncbi:peptidoglycan binding protein CsiV [Vibrio japonicus]|uniref:Peptidoglycan binding protein CsiV n=1 Tax=Vibrio japonicus TaxID=1824638 RepID=A0ABY5LP43_9VIBR|nr:peptidoglycan binding protein CsiV [Vibrio japonicus]UUM31520.1 peptidoglycan binding protein CsiV [Vibrio japonicus]
MKKLIPLLLFLIALPSWAQQFDVEVIVFKRTVNPEQTVESWPDVLPKIDLENAGNLSDSDFRAQKGVQILPSSSYQLNGSVDKLNQHAGFKVLLHTAWRQNGKGRLSAPALHIQAGKDFSSSYNSDGTLKGSIQGTELLDGVSETSIPVPLYELDGKIQIYVDHYLYADVQMDVRAPSVREIVLQVPLKLESNQENDAAVQSGFMAEVEPTIQKQELLKSFRIIQKRRMKSSETHYLDHPLMGIIIQVRRV